MIVGYGNVEIVGEPTNPPDGEHVLSVELLAVPEAVERLRSSDQDWEADLLEVVVEVRRARMLDA